MPRFSSGWDPGFDRYELTPAVDPYETYNPDSPVSFGVLMTPPDGRYLRYVQSRPVPQTRPEDAQGWWLQWPGIATRHQSVPQAQGRDPKIGLPPGGLLPGTGATGGDPRIMYGPPAQYRDEALRRYLGPPTKPNVRELDSEQRDSFMPARPMPPSKRSQPTPQQPPGGARPPQPLLEGEPAPTTGKPPIRPDLKGGSPSRRIWPGLQMDGSVGVELDAGGGRRFGGSVEGDLSHGGKPAETQFHLNKFKMWLKSPEGQRWLLERSFRDNGIRFGFELPI